MNQLRRAASRHATLLKNSGALAFAAASAAVLGFAYWWLAARCFSPDAMGKASALLSLMGFAGLLGDAGLGTLLAGEIIRNPKTQHGLIMAAILVALFLSVAVSGIGLWLLGLSFAASQGLTSDLASNARGLAAL
jgi:O-antigen/teichoic acid export membrane protein